MIPNDSDAAADTWPLWRRLINRMPSWAQGLTGLGARESLENALASYASTDRECNE